MGGSELIVSGIVRLNCDETEVPLTTMTKCHVRMGKFLAWLKSKQIGKSYPFSNSVNPNMGVESLVSG